eukprot:TRINITY_DN8082_c1_g1_i3.p1 TRINITY_DN8082_c1_g1~~TRINITY_DN8082_c1_g1_i3.p1  ORF type:complete len:280 (+),score=37.91 TRINITY_DN8082_c1_g1_i3:68-907(+)
MEAVVSTQSTGEIHVLNRMLTLSQLNQQLRTKVCDWLFDNLLNDLVSSKSQESTFQKAYDQLAESLALTYLTRENEWMEEMISMVKENAMHKSVPVISDLTRQFESFFSFLRGFKSPSALDRQIFAFALLRICERYSVEKSAVFQCLETVKQQFKELSSNSHRSVLNWGNGVVSYLHARAIVPMSSIEMTVVKSLLSKAIDQMLEGIFHLKQHPEEVSRSFQNRYYILSSAYGLDGNFEECLFWFTKAKVKGEIPKKEEILGNSAFKNMIWYFFLFLVN